MFRSLLTMVGAVEVTLTDVLAHVAERAAEVLPGVEHACVCVDLANGDRERAATSDVAAACDVAEQDLDGPGAVARTRRRAVVSADLTDDPRWPRLAASLGGKPVRSLLIVPLLAPTGVLGVLSMSAAARSAFDDRGARLAVRFAATAARTVQDALVLDQARRLTAQRRLRAHDRAAVDRAIAVLMTENGVRAEEAYGVLQLLGRTEQDDLITVARAIVNAGNGQRARTAGSSTLPPALPPRG